MNFNRQLIIWLITTCIAGCATFSPREVAKPNEVTLEQALTSVGAGLCKMKEAQKDMKTGLIAESVEVTFNLSASAKDSGKLTIDLSSAVAAEPVTNKASIGAEIAASSKAARANTIKIKFINILTIPKDTLACIKSPEDLKRIILVPAAAGWTVFGDNIAINELMKATGADVVD